MNNLHRKFGLDPIKQENVCLEISNKVVLLDLKRNTRLLSPGQTQDYLYYINDGVVRSYSVVDGREWTNWFYKKDDFLVSADCFFFNKQSLDYFETCDDVRLYAIKIDDVNYLLSKYEVIKRIEKDILGDFFSRGRQLTYLLSNLNSSQRYESFVEEEDYVNNRVIRKYLASYLGVSPEFLSKVEKKYLKDVKDRAKRASVNHA